MLAVSEPMPRLACIFEDLDGLDRSCRPGTLRVFEVDATVLLLGRGEGQQ